MTKNFYGRAGGLFLLGCWCVFSAGHCGAAGIAEYPIPNAVTPFTGCRPEGITRGPDGAYWFVEFYGGRVGRIDTNGVIVEYFIPSANSEPSGITVGPDGNLWFTEAAYPQLGRITTNGVITEFPTLSGTVATAITRGSDNRLWVLDFGALFFQQGFATNGGVMAFGVNSNGLTSTNYYNTNMTVNSRPASITAGPDGNLWFTEQLSGRIGRITTNGVITESALLPAGCHPFDIITGPDGALWFTENAANVLGRIDTGMNLSPALGYPLPVNPTAATYDQPYGLVLANDGSIWYHDSAAGFLGRVTVAGTNLTSTNIYFAPTTNAFPLRLATGPDGNIWFGEYPNDTPGYVNNIGRVIAQPPLNIQNLGGFQFVLSWPTNATTNFVLQDNGSLTNTNNWMTLTNIPAVSGSQFVVTNTSVTNLFFRLIAQ